MITRLLQHLATDPINSRADFLGSRLFSAHTRLSGKGWLAFLGVAQDGSKVQGPKPYSGWKHSIDWTTESTRWAFPKERESVGQACGSNVLGHRPAGGQGTAL